MAEEEEVETNAANANNNAAQGDSTKKLMLVLVVVFLVMNAIWGAVFFLGFHGQTNLGGDSDAVLNDTNGSAEAAEDLVKESFEVGPTMDLQPFIVNLNEPQSARFLRVSITLELGEDEARDRVEQRMVRLRDQFINYLSSQTVNELRSQEGKEYLRQELLQAAQQVVSRQDIKNIYFTDFMIQ